MSFEYPIILKINKLIILRSQLFHNIDLTKPCHNQIIIYFFTLLSKKNYTIAINYNF